MSEEKKQTFDEGKLLQQEEPIVNEKSEQTMSTEEAMLNELRLIREQLFPKEEKEEVVEDQTEKRFFRRFSEEFILFIKNYKILGLAVAFIMATYVGLLVQALVDDIIMPIFQYLPGLRDLDQLSDWKVGYFLIGDFISVSITFLMISLVIFLIVKVGTRLGIETD